MPTVFSNAGDGAGAVRRNVREAEGYAAKYLSAMLCALLTDMLPIDEKTIWSVV